MAGGERLGEPIAQGHRSYDLMRSLQLGIVFSIARTSHAAAPGAPAPEPSAADFAEQAHSSNLGPLPKLLCLAKKQLGMAGGGAAGTGKCTSKRVSPSVL